MRFIFAAIAALATAQLSTSQIDVSNLNVNDASCTYEAAQYETLIDHIAEQKVRLESTQSALADLEALLNKDWEEAQPMSEQMNALEAATIEQASQRVQSGMTIELIESKRTRDLTSISIFYSLNANLGNASNSIEKLDYNNQIHFGLLVAAAELMPMEFSYSVDLSDGAKCSLKNALIKEAHSQLDRTMDVYGWKAASRDYVALKDKYGGEIDRERMSKDELDRLDNDILPTLEKVQIRAEKAKNLYRLALIESMSKKMLRARRMDQYDAPNDIEYMGTNWSRIAEQSKFSENELTAARLLTQLNELVPTDVVRALEEIE